MPWRSAVTGAIVRLALTAAAAADRRRRQSLQAEMRALPDVENGKDQSGSTAVMTLLSPTHVICSTARSKCPLGSAPAQLLRLLRARLTALSG